MNVYLLALQALMDGCTGRQTELLTGLSGETIDALSTALEGESSGADVYRDLTVSDMDLASAAQGEGWYP